jgi:hypothetical protein
MTCTDSDITDFAEGSVIPPREQKFFFEGTRFGQGPKVFGNRSRISSLVFSKKKIYYPRNLRMDEKLTYLGTFPRGKKLQLMITYKVQVPVG